MDRRTYMMWWCNDINEFWKLFTKTVFVYVWLRKCGLFEYVEVKKEGNQLDVGPYNKNTFEIFNAWLLLVIEYRITIQYATYIVCSANQ